MNEPLAIGINFGNPEMHDMEHVLNRCANLGKIYYGYINKDEDVPLEDYFKKYLCASRKNGRSLILLQYSCDINCREEVVSAWEKAESQLQAG